MVVGRRRVAAASVATAYALHIYVLPSTVFDLPDRLSRLFRLIPHCRKVGVHPSSGYFSWVLVPHPYFPRVLSLYSSPTWSLSLEIYDNPSSSQIELHVRRKPGHIAQPPLFRSALPASIHPLLAHSPSFTLTLVPLSLVPTACLGPLAMSYTRIEVVDIVLRSVSKLRENDGLVVLVVWVSISPSFS